MVAIFISLILGGLGWVAYHGFGIAVDAPRYRPAIPLDDTGSPAYRARHAMLDRALPPVEVPAPVVEVPTPEPEKPQVYFKAGEPTTFDEYSGQEHILGYLRDAVRGLGATESALEPMLFLGMAGMGKTLLAKVVANELRLRAQRLGLPTGEFQEVFPADFEDLESLDAVMRRIIDRPGSVVFIDEIHDLVGPLSRKLYLVLEEGRYLFHGDTTPTKLPPVTLLGATTDYGALHPALQRRWIKHYLKPATVEQLVGYLMRRPFAIVESCARRIVERTRFSGAPWEGLELRRMAVTAAKGDGATVVSDVQVDRVFQQQEIDELGLRWLDRQVITALLGQPRYRMVKGEKTFVCYGASEQNACTLARIDKSEYRETVRPRLMSRGLLEIRPTYGQALTEWAVRTYGHLRPRYGFDAGRAA